MQGAKGVVVDFAEVSYNILVKMFEEEAFRFLGDFILFLIVEEVMSYIFLRRNVWEDVVPFRCITSVFWD